VAQSLDSANRASESPYGVDGLETGALAEESLRVAPELLDLSEAMMAP
jgi:hypothetical protein